jgi:CRISPR/Cas system-associated exonuclease Cas4 (RecB family)
MDIPVGTIMYISFSADVPAKEFIVEFDEDRWNACTAKMDKALELVKNKELPPAEGMGVNPYFCTSCPYYYLCRDKTVKAPNGDLGL